LSNEPKRYSSLTDAEIVFLGSVAVCTRLDCCHNEDTRKEPNVTLITANTDSYRKRWGEHSLRMDGSRF